jgi:hypothetical protein
VHAAVDDLVLALYVSIDDLLRAHPEQLPPRPTVGFVPKITDAELITLAVMANLEKRHAQLKGTQLVAPMWLRDPARIEGLLTCHFIAMLTSALIERTIRRAMTQAGLDQLSLYPEDRGCAAPTTARILEIFTPWLPATNSPPPTAPCCAPSTPNSPTYNNRSSTCSTSPPASTAPSRRCR